MSTNVTTFTARGNRAERIKTLTERVAKFLETLEETENGTPVPTIDEVDVDEFRTIVGQIQALKWTLDRKGYMPVQTTIHDLTRIDPAGVTAMPRLHTMRATGRDLLAQVKTVQGIADRNQRAIEDIRSTLNLGMEQHYEPVRKALEDPRWRKPPERPEVHESVRFRYKFKESVSGHPHTLIFDRLGMLLPHPRQTDGAHMWRVLGTQISIPEQDVVDWHPIPLEPYEGPFPDLKKPVVPANP